MVEEQPGIDVGAEVDAEAMPALLDRSPDVRCETLVLMTFAATDEPFSLLDERLRRTERVLRGSLHVVEPRIATAAFPGVIEVTIVIDHERAFVGVDRDRQLGDVAVVDPPARHAL